MNEWSNQTLVLQGEGQDSTYLLTEPIVQLKSTQPPRSLIFLYHKYTPRNMFTLMPKNIKIVQMPAWKGVGKTQ